MTTLESFLSSDVAPAQQVAALIEQNTNGDLALTVGNAVTEPQDVSELLPGGDAKVLGITLGAGRGGLLAVALSPDLAEGLRVAANASLPAAVRPLLAAALAALEAANGVLDGGDDVLDLTPNDVVGAADDPVVAIPLLEGTERVATVILREGDATGAGTPAATDADAADADAPAATVHEFQPIEASGSTAGAVERALELLNDVEMEVTAELGRRKISVRDLLSLTPGAVVELDRAAGSPVDVLVNGHVIARGEVVVIDEEFGIRISEVIGRDEEH